MYNKDFNCMADEEIELFGKQLHAALRTIRQATSRMSKMTRRVDKNELYSKLLQMSIDTDIEITARKKHGNESI